MQPYQQRVIEEREQLSVKYNALDTFVNGQVFLNLPGDEQDRLLRQRKIMGEYLEILDERIAAFKP
jgi:hypothetical protein